MAGSNTRMIRLIQVGIRKLGLAGEQYRAIYEGRTGKRSLKAMTQKEMFLVLDAFRELGFNKDEAAGDASLCASPRARKIRFLWLDLKGMGELRDSSEKALLAYVKRLTGVSRMEWLTAVQMSYVIETLKSWGERVRAARLAGRAAPADEGGGGAA